MWRSFWRSIDRFSLQHFKLVRSELIVKFRDHKEFRASQASSSSGRSLWSLLELVDQGPSLGVKSGDRSSDRLVIRMVHVRYLVNELQEIKNVDKLNRELVVDILSSIVEIVTYGDQHDPSIFECFMESQILAEFLRILKISRNSSIEAPLLHYLSIMIQNLASEHAIYYCLSNEYINNIILHHYEFDVGDLALYYVSFLRTVSGKLNRDTLCLLVKVQEDVVVSFPLYSEALKFACHGEKMIQIAVRALTLNIYNVSDDMVHKFITTSPVSEYFSDLVLNLREQCFHLDAIVGVKMDTYTPETRKELLRETDKIVDDLYYCKDILCVGKSRLSRLMTKHLLSLLVLPILLPLLQLSETIGRPLSAITSLYIVSRLLQVVDDKELVNSVAVAIIYSSMLWSVQGSTVRDTTGDHSQANFVVDYFKKMEEMSHDAPESEGAENIKRNYMFGPFSEYISSSSHFTSCLYDDTQRERSGMLSLIFSENHSLLLASLMLLLVLSESKDLDYLLSSMMGFSRKKNGMEQMMTSDISISHAMNGSIFVRHMPQILNALLNVLRSHPPFSIPAIWNSGWVVQKLLISQEKLIDHDYGLFNTSYEQSCERLLKELNGCWFDFIPVTLKNEWESCKTALEKSSQSKDPFFSLELSSHKYIPDNEKSSSLSWQRMVDAVKVFVLHRQLKAFIFKGDSLENPLLHLRSGLMANSEITHGLDISSATFGTELALGPGVPCKIAFAKRGLRNIYLIPVTKGIYGKLLLVEKLPVQTQRGVVTAIAPLAGLSNLWYNGRHNRTDLYNHIVK
ncbi:hypothetical protein HHK36_011459 [Tetracentron sinense]|uniref:FPL domain-containing protein n=1 Tax=Tetracentron sinense TaxID=13715 RepID=A0A834ZIN1_TETSI|nr:hypothetical protein HHK36_011459 [Tetracentron sinense]